MTHVRFNTRTFNYKTYELNLICTDDVLVYCAEDTRFCVDLSDLMVLQYRVAFRGNLFVSLQRLLCI